MLAGRLKVIKWLKIALFRISEIYRKSLWRKVLQQRKTALVMMRPKRIIREGVGGIYAL
jgi:hypothetical protein